MLHRNPTDSNPTARPRDTRIFWTAEEYQAIARELVRLYPRALVDGHVPGLTITDLNRAIIAALPPERRRRMANEAHLVSFSRRLRDTVEGKTIWTAEEYNKISPPRTPPPPPPPPPPPAPAPASQAAADKGDWRNGPRVLWTNSEWDELLAKLVARDPELQTNPDWLTLAQLNEVSATMARPRKFHAIGPARSPLEQARARAAALPARVLSVPTPAPAAPPAPEPSASPEPAPAPEPQLADKLFSKITWTPAEWLRIAEELHRMHPVENYPYRGNLVGLETEDVAFAQERVLPLERQRRHLKVVSFTTLRAQLERAFAALKDKLEAARPAAVDEAEAPASAPDAAPLPPIPAVSHPIPSDSPAAPFPIFQPAAEEAARNVPRAEDYPAPDPYRAAFAPLVSLLMDELMTRLHPALAELVERTVVNAVAKLPAPAALAATPAPAMPPLAPTVGEVRPETAQTKHYGDEKPKATKVKKLVVAVLVNRPKQYKEELEKTFPQIEVRAIDSGNNTLRMGEVDKAIGMTRFIDHVAGDRFKKANKGVYVDCNGGMSELKRIIGIWLRSLDIGLDAAA